jgi:hypothetical protein
VRRLTAATIAAMFAAAGALSCGASLRAVYEGDVRFEHCMALDARADVKPTLRRACWEEWVSFYTFGQTRDRIDYALGRERQLDNASDFDEADAHGPKLAALPAAAPDPTSAIAPPPMTQAAGDAGAPASVAHLDEADERTAAHARCTAECQQGLDACRQGCKGPACERACSGRLQRCTGRCERGLGATPQAEPRRQGSR